jgi:energy-converting hydrogenase Eha subunit H
MSAVITAFPVVASAGTATTGLATLASSETPEGASAAVVLCFAEILLFVGVIGELGISAARTTLLHSSMANRPTPTDEHFIVSLVNVRPLTAALIYASTLLLLF